MHRFSGVLVVTVLILGGVQARATVEPFLGIVGISIGGLPPVGMGGTGFATVNGSGPGSHINTLSLPASPFATVGVVIPISDPAAFPIKGFKLTAHNGAGAFGGAPLGGVMPIAGVMKVCLFASCNAGPPANMIVPLTVVGAGGAATVATLVNITAIGAPWTTGTAAVGTLTINGFRHGPASLTSSTADFGEVQLVTPAFLSTNLGGSVVPILGVLDVYVPEPSTLLLLGSGVAGLLLLARSKRG